VQNNYTYNESVKPWKNKLNITTLNITIFRIEISIVKLTITQGYGEESYPSILSVIMLSDISGVSLCHSAKRHPALQERMPSNIMPIKLSMLRVIVSLSITITP